MLKEKIERTLELLKENHFQLCNITNCLHIDKTTNDQQVISADIVMNFFRNFSSSREEAMKELESVPDPCTTSSSRKLLKFNNPKHLAQLVERMVQAYHSLANSGSMKDFLSMENFETCGYFSTILPNQFSSLPINMYRTECIQSRLKLKSGDDIVNIRKKHFQNAIPGLMLEARGNSLALFKLKEMIRDMVASTSLFTRGDTKFSRIFIHVAFKIIFDSCSGLEDEIVMTDYTG